MQRKHPPAHATAPLVLAGARITILAEPSTPILAVEDRLRAAGASVMRTPSRRAGAMRPDSCDVVIVRIERADGATEAVPRGPLFAPHRTLALVDEPLPPQPTPVRDFVLPPFRPAEVVARVARMLTPQSGQGMLHAGNLELHTASRTASVGGRAVELTFHEFEILRVLMAANGGVLSREDMVRHLAHDAPPDSRWVDIHIHRLRTKLRALRGAGIETVRGVGYRLTRR
jgi:hypothetical protein